VAIEWADDAAGREAAGAAVPAGLKLDHQTARKWEGRFTGDMRELLAFAAGKPVVDFRVARPDLESLFRRYYTDEGVGGES
jgi:hypothetical protein